MSVTINGRRATMEEERQLAIEMWEFVRVCQTDIYSRWDSESLKKAFCRMKRRCGIDINWISCCFLCHHTISCLDCPLYKIGNGKTCCDDESYFDITMHPENYTPCQIDSAINRIIEAIASFEG